MKTILLLRHADVDPAPGPAPNSWPLNELGKARAEALAHVLGVAGVASLYVSPALRTQQTAAPLATKLGLAPQQVPATAAQLAAEVMADPGRPVVVVVGHSNTVPEFIAAFGVPFVGLPLHRHDDLFVLTVAGKGQRGLMRLKYGWPSDGT